MEIEQYRKYAARIKYHRSDNLKPDSAPDGTNVTVTAMWLSGDDEPCPGQWVFLPDDGGYWLPECDLEIIEPLE